MAQKYKYSFSVFYQKKIIPHGPHFQGPQYHQNNHFSARFHCCRFHFHPFHQSDQLQLCVLDRLRAVVIHPTKSSYDIIQNRDLRWPSSSCCCCWGSGRHFALDLGHIVGPLNWCDPNTDFPDPQLSTTTTSTRQAIPTYTIYTDILALWYSDIPTFWYSNIQTFLHSAILTF